MHPLKQYLTQYAEKTLRPLAAGSLEGIDQAVVIPALAERDAIVETLWRLSRNAPADLARTLVICVVNNRREGLASAEHIENNQQTLKLLRRLMAGDSRAAGMTDDPSGRLCSDIAGSGLRLAFIDASSRGMEMPDRGGGVGLARKIGLDRALTLFECEGPLPKLLLNLDADTWVEPDYLASVRRFFEGCGAAAAVASYAHRPERHAALQAAICSYEIFLRYYVLGLTWAGSPYAFHTIGSTMVCTARGYAAVRGMTRRDAAEDFYFLNKLAKLGSMGRIPTTVHPSARPSRRVPFGTGQRVIRYLEGGQDEYLLYDPEVFRILRRWLALAAGGGLQRPHAVMDLASRIHPLLAAFLEAQRFEQAWQRIRDNHRGSEGLVRAFHVWFDAFKTLKLVHDLTGKGFPRIEMLAALQGLLRNMDIRCPVPMSQQTRSDSGSQRKILAFLRQCDNLSLTQPMLSYNGRPRMLPG